MSLRKRELQPGQRLGWVRSEELLWEVELLDREVGHGQVQVQVLQVHASEEGSDTQPPQPPQQLAPLRELLPWPQAQQLLAQRRSGALRAQQLNQQAQQLGVELEFYSNGQGRVQLSWAEDEHVAQLLEAAWAQQQDRAQRGLGQLLSE